MKFILNNELINCEQPSGNVLLDFIRDEKHLVGTKEGCREGDCGACTVLLGELIDDRVVYKTVNSCLYPLGNITGRHVVTIEGLNGNDLNIVQKEYVKENASQCGFCTPGFIVSTIGYLINNEKIINEDFHNSIAGNICRCTGYVSIKKALENISDEVKHNADVQNRIHELISAEILPDYFMTIRDRLISLQENIISNTVNSKMLVGGGTDLYIQKPDEMYSEDILTIPNSMEKFIDSENGNIVIFANTSFEELNNSDLIKELLPEIKIYNSLIASLPIRNSATLAGNFINASPIGDMTIIFLALNAKLIFDNNSNKREILLKDFYYGYKILDKSADEILEKIIIQKPTGSYKFNFEKVSKRTHLDIASVNSALYIETAGDKILNCNLSIGGVAPIPLYLIKTSAFLIGQKINVELIKETIELVQKEISPISDIRGSDEYKRLVAAQIIKAHFIKLFPEKFSMELLK